MLDTIQWKSRTFPQLGLEKFFDILKLRMDVFVVEQACAYSELEEYDRHETTQHLCGRTKNDVLVAYARILPPGLRYPEVNLGRFVVQAKVRRQGLGHLLLQTSLQEIQKLWPGNGVKISAQVYLQEFYAKYGFRPVSEVFSDGGVPHVEMVKDPEEVPK